MEDRSIDDWSNVGDEENRDGFPISMDLQEIEESRENTGIVYEHQADGFRRIYF